MFDGYALRSSQSEGDLTSFFQNFVDKDFLLGQPKLSGIGHGERKQAVDDAFQ